jgi:hypothetical protein
VAAINRAKPRVALLYSPTSVFWSEKYQATLYSMYTQLNFLGEKVTFVSERQLAAGKAAKVDAIIIPQATNVTDDTFAALFRFAHAGGKLILVGGANLARDEYDRPRIIPELTGVAKLDPKGTEAESAQALHDMLLAGGMKLNELTDAAGTRAWGIEYRVVDAPGGSLMPLINLMKTPQTIAVPEQFAGATDLLSGKAVGSSVELAPMVPLLLRVERK